MSVGRTQVWAVTDGGVAMKRHGICSENPAGTGWNLGISVCIDVFNLINDL